MDDLAISVMHPVSFAICSSKDNSLASASTNTSSTVTCPSNGTLPLLSTPTFGMHFFLFN